VYITVGRVNPETGLPERRAWSDLNTGTCIWLETGPSALRPGPARLKACDDPQLDTSGPTFEAAIVLLARKVRAAYGHDRGACDQDLQEWLAPATGTSET
jgi:hypothetical protein